MSYVDAALAPQRKTGQIKLHGPAAFEGMRKAGRLVAECLDMLTGEIGPGVVFKVCREMQRKYFDATTLDESRGYSKYR